MSTPPLSPAARPATGRRESVLEDLLGLFLAQGFAHLGLADMAREVRCSKTTLYAVAPSKEQIVTATVRAFFRRATERVEAAVPADGPAATRLSAYVEAIARELAPAGPAFVADLLAFAPTAEIYRRNTEAAAERVRGLVSEAATVSDRLDPAFVGLVAALVMESIQRGTVARRTGLDDSAAYAALGDLLLAVLR